jgi:hypothetical protein
MTSIITVFGTLPRSRLTEATAIALLLWHTGAQICAQERSTRIFENDRVVIWNVARDAPDQFPLRERRLPALLVSLADGSVHFREPGDSRALPDNPPAVLVELKDSRVPPIVSPRGVARAFPRTGATPVIENDRIAVWDLAWTTGMKTPVHFHDRDVVAVYLGAGTVRSIPLDGEPTATPRSRGEAVFLPRGRTHIEECVDGPRRDIIIELK